MAYMYEGLVEIPLEDFWKFIEGYTPKTSGEVVYGVPKVDKGAGTLNIAFAVGNKTHPKDWARKPVAVEEWENYFGG